MKEQMDSNNKKLAVAVAVVVIVLICAISTYAVYKKNNIKSDDYITKLKARMDQEEVLKADTMYIKTVDMYGLYEYANGALMMSIDPDRVRTLDMVFEIKGDTDSLAVRYSEFAESEEFISDIAEKLGYDSDATWFSDLLSAEPNENHLEINVILPESSDSEDFENAIRDAVMAYDPGLGADIEMISSRIKEKRDISIREMQQDVYDGIKADKAEIERIHSISTNNVELLYNAYLEREGLLEKVKSGEIGPGESFVN